MNKGKWEEEIIIMTDSKSTLQSLANNKINAYTNKYILEIKYWYDKIISEMKRNIIFIWISAHKGIKGNEIADKIAKEAAEVKEHGRIDVPINDLKIESARCECGYELETLNHTIWQCHLYDEERIKLDEELRKRGCKAHQA
ncbi:hypothetical protein PV328_008384 [Microctonus aethiopoides]|uniref:RNase H type-1 domain-containing protein n=1 Tax=Microctonus aethiopoides TaxID=144406 RepID=A0AA39KR60_9HYME|nr:hypothetical protein PV328_008384 [Microctonus aethiopoides]